MPQWDILYDYVAPLQSDNAHAGSSISLEYSSFSVIFCAPCPLPQYRVTNWRYPLVNLSLLLSLSLSLPT